MEIIYPIEVYQKYPQHINTLKKIALEFCGEVAMTAINQVTGIYVYDDNDESTPDYTVEIHVELPQHEIRAALFPPRKIRGGTASPLTSKTLTNWTKLNVQYAQCEYDDMVAKVNGHIRRNWPVDHKEWLTLSKIGKNLDKLQPLNIKGVEVVFKENPS